MHFYYYEEDREPAEEADEQPSEKDSVRKPIVISLYYFDFVQVMDE